MMNHRKENRMTTIASIAYISIALLCICAGHLLIIARNNSVKITNIIMYLSLALLIIGSCVTLGLAINTAVTI